MYVVGVDGCRAGWVTVRLDLQGGAEAGIFPNFAVLWKKHQQAALILVDIPIGLKDGGREERQCDKEARKFLGPRKSSVFPVPCRAAVYQPDYDAAIRENLHHTGKSIFKAVWQIVPKIREVDELLLSAGESRAKVRESHPEVCFWALNGGKPMAYNKKTGAGMRERQSLLQIALAAIHPSLGGFLEVAQILKPRGVAPDDFLDALALAATALLGQRHGLAAIPNDPETDARSLPMEMVHLKRETECSRSL